MLCQCFGLMTHIALSACKTRNKGNILSCLDNSIGIVDHHFFTENNLSRAKKAEYDDDHSFTLAMLVLATLIILTFYHDDHPDHFVISHGLPFTSYCKWQSSHFRKRRLEVPNPSCRRKLEALELLMVVVRWGMVMMHRHV